MQEVAKKDLIIFVKFFFLLRQFIAAKYEMVIKTQYITLLQCSFHELRFNSKVIFKNVISFKTTNACIGMNVSSI